LSGYQSRRDDQYLIDDRDSQYNPHKWAGYRRVDGWEASMSGIEVVVAIFLLIAFISGAVIGVVVIVSVASRREDRLYSLAGEAPDAMCRGARRFMGVWATGDWPSRVSRPRDDAQRREAPR
jgi:hypothetical protein